MRFILFCILIYSSSFACDLDKDGFTDSLVKVKDKRLKVFLTTGSTKTINTQQRILSFSCKGRNVVTNHKSGSLKHRITGFNRTGGIGAVCRSVRGLNPGEVWKSIGSNHFPPGDPRRWSNPQAEIVLQCTPRMGSQLPSLVCIEETKRSTRLDFMGLVDVEIEKVGHRSRLWLEKSQEHPEYISRQMVETAQLFQIREAVIIVLSAKS
jgi:hypothetical protein